MWDLAVREEDYKAVDAMLQRYSGAPLSFRALPLFARHDSAGVARLLDEARALDARQSQIAARYVATFLLDTTDAVELARLDLQPRRNARIRLTAQTFLAWLQVANHHRCGTRGHRARRRRVPARTLRRVAAAARGRERTRAPRARVRSAVRERSRVLAGIREISARGIAAGARPHR